MAPVSMAVVGIDDDQRFALMKVSDINTLFIELFVPVDV